uniref:CSON002821 protein n=1 Tax=Culicoides sonorensis TaxID=179676 RepID=A0A336LSJ0_CULSO
MDTRSLLSYLLEPEPEVRVHVFDPWRYAVRSFDHHRNQHPHKHNQDTQGLFSQYLKELQKDFETIQKLDDTGFRFRVDVQHYKPEEIMVKLEGNTVIVEGKHEERSDAHGTISRQFTRKFALPQGVVDIDKLSSTFSSDGVLTIHAPKLQAVENKNRTIPIERTGPVKESIKQSEEANKEEQK